MRASRAVLAALAVAVSAVVLSVAEVRGDGPETGPGWKIGDDAGFFYNQGVRAVRKGEWRIAVAYFKRAADRDPANADVQNMLGFSYRKLGSSDDALGHYRRALELDPRHRAAHEYMGEAYLERGDLPRAEGLHASLRKLCPDGCDELAKLEAAIRRFKEREP